MSQKVTNSSLDAFQALCQNVSMKGKKCTPYYLDKSAFYVFNTHIKVLGSTLVIST
jgi:hypothetical protein